MSSKGAATREKILSNAESIILQKGFSATSIEEIIQASHITKSGFFYHFTGKNELALGLVERYLKEDDQLFTELFQRADSLSEDPLQSYLIFLKLFAEVMGDLPQGHPGCLVASFTYESMQVEPEVLDRVAHGVHQWRKLFSGRINAIREKYPMAVEIATEELADMVITLVEGGIITSLTLNQPQVLPQQLLQYRNFIRLLFGDVR